MKILKQSITLLLACLTVFTIISTPLSGYMTPILGLIIVFSVIFLILKRRRNKNEDLFVGSNIEVFAITLALLLAIILTGSLNSNLFFLLYFLLFAIVFLYEPPTVFVLLAGFLIIFWQAAIEGDIFGNLIKLGSLAFIAPISYFFGREFKRRDEPDKKSEPKASNNK